jgi:hypothetical protein
MELFLFMMPPSCPESGAMLALVSLPGPLDTPLTMDHASRSIQLTCRLSPPEKNSMAVDGFYHYESSQISPMHEWVRQPPPT